MTEVLKKVLTNASMFISFSSSTYLSMYSFSFSPFLFSLFSFYMNLLLICYYNSRNQLRWQIQVQLAYIQGLCVIQSPQRITCLEIKSNNQKEFRWNSKPQIYLRAIHSSSSQPTAGNTSKKLPSSTPCIPQLLQGLSTAKPLIFTSSLPPQLFIMEILSSQLSLHFACYLNSPTQKDTQCLTRTVGNLFLVFPPFGSLCPFSYFDFLISPGVEKAKLKHSVEDEEKVSTNQSVN